MPIGALNTALAGLQVAQQMLDVTSQNIANAQTPGYTEKTLPLSTQVIGNNVSVQTGLVTRNVNQFLQTDYRNASSTSAYWNNQSTYLTNLQAISGKPGSASSMASLLSTVADDFTQLSANPASSIEQQQTVTDAQSFASSLNQYANFVVQQRNETQTDITQSVQTINTALSQIAQLNKQIAQETYAGRSTANLADQRDQAIQTLSQQMSISSFTRSDGVVVVQTPTGQLLADTVAQPVTFTSAPIGPSSYYPASVNGVIVGSGPTAFDLAAGSPGGTLGSLLNLRDQVLPQQQAQLDEMAEQTANAFAAQGVKLFSDSTGAIPPNVPGSYVGFAQLIQVNPAVSANPSLLQQGTGGGPAIPAGDNTNIMNVINNAFDANTTFNTSGLGPSLSISTGLPASATLQSYAAQIIAGQANLLSHANNLNTSESAYSSALQQQLTNSSGVSLDSELSSMLTIQKSYGAAAQMIKTVNQIFDELFQAIQ
ncbi:MAG TPA: flagellar hook-associated protein FlgK [Alphaproteobacteria bacterium]|nr:flagellar hook-associated protein FlgK [Alphaproteobacteria bacterium]